MKKNIRVTWKKESKAVSRLTMLEGMVNRGEALSEAVRMGKSVSNKKQVPDKGGCDKTVVDLIMQRKLQDARKDVKQLREAKKLIVAEVGTISKYT